jgi:hypothetical protein
MGFEQDLRPPAEARCGFVYDPGPKSTSDQDHPHTGHAGSSPQIPNVKTEDTAYELLRPSVWKEISCGDANHQGGNRKAIWTLRSTMGAYLYLIDKAFRSYVYLLLNYLRDTRPLP